MSRFQRKIANEYLTHAKLETELLYTQLRQEVLEHTLRLLPSYIKGLRQANTNLSTKLSDVDLAGYIVCKLNECGIL